MAKKVEVTLIDDVDGSEAAETVRFVLDGVQYEIDLSAENAERLRRTVYSWVDAGRRRPRRLHEWTVDDLRDARAERQGVSRGA